MKRILIIICILGITLCGCHNKSKQQDEDLAVELTEESVQNFALRIENAILNGNPMVLNNAFAEDIIKDSVSQNSIVFSSLDTDFGQAFWKSNFRLGDYCATMVNEGGDFKFVRQYVKDGQHHIIFRTYCDYGLRFDDFTVCAGDTSLKIVDGFIYNLSTSFIHNLQYDMLYQILQKTDPEGVTKYLSDASALLDQGKSADALKMLNEHNDVLHEYPYYWQMLIRAQYEASPKTFIAELDKLAEQGFDERAILTHKLLYYANQGEVQATEEVINRLIEFTGDDPIYLLFYGRANFVSGYYQDALTCYQNAAQNLPMLWDIWYGLLECYAQLNDKDNFGKTANIALENFGMTNAEITELIQNDFPKMR